MDYGKLRYLVQIDQTLNGNFSRLREIIETGEQVSDIQTSFPVETLLQPENFVSLLYYLGLLTFAGEREGAPWLNLTPYFRVWSESKWGGGFVDLYLAPFYARYRYMRHAYLIELKYLKHTEDSPVQREKVMAEAQAQLRQYAQETRVQEALGPAPLHPLALVYSGWEWVKREEVTMAEA